MATYVWSNDRATAVTEPSVLSIAASGHFNARDMNHEPSVPQMHFKFCLKSNMTTFPASVPTQIRPFAAMTVGEPIFSVPSRDATFWDCFAKRKSPIVFKCVHLNTSRVSEVTLLLPSAPLRAMLVVEDDLDNAETCDGLSEAPSGVCEKSVPTLADDGTRDAWGVIDRSREIVGWRKGSDSLLGVPLPLLGIGLEGEGAPDTDIGGVGGVEGVSSGTDLTG